MLPALILVTLFGELFLPPFGQGRETAKVMNDASISLNFMSFNLRWDNPNHNKIAAVIRSAQADVVGFQEVRPDHIVGFLQHLPEYPHRYFQLTKEFHNVGIVSRFPIRSMTPINVENSRIERGFQVELLVNGELIRVIVTHLAPNNAPLFPLPEFAKITQGRQEQRLQQVDFLGKVLSQSRQPTIVLCDCNFTPTSGTYRRLGGLMQDSFYEVGWGLGHTIKLDAFPIYLGRIDYVWHSREFQSISATVGDCAGSDHRPIIARLELIRDRVVRR
jgi:endonuclease/exonuclease/phosphatase (EEP) superfamily protein YafD